MTRNSSSADLPRGFSFSATACGLKKSGLDLALLASERPATAAAMFTQNLVQSAPVQISRAHLRESRSGVRGIIVNSGNANCCTGPQGLATAKATAREVARELASLSPSKILVCSTGVIGAPLRAGKILRAVPGLVKSRSSTASAFAKFTRAIMTTDTRPKWASARFRIGGKTVRLVGCAKGSGMIHPNMATMLAFLATDAAVVPDLLSSALRSAVDRTLNSITVDGDTSTNDTVILLANGASGTRQIARKNADFRRLCRELHKVCSSLAQAIVRDGEGARRMIEVEVRGAPSEDAARRVAHTIATSPLVKTAVAGGDPNWGRVLAAAGRSGVRFDPRAADVYLAGIKVCQRGREKPFSEKALHRKMLANFVPIAIHLHRGSRKSRVWSCDFTAEYVKINSSYRT
jgi:glutamate N-acetyltransferase/amino-acid N-acetyltransferase